MNTSALITMVATILVVTLLTIYFFILVLKAPVRPEPDSFEHNDPENGDADLPPVHR